jgi:hypothetical protein
VDHLEQIKKWIRPKILDKNSTYDFGGKPAYYEYARWYKKKGYSKEYKFRKAEREFFLKVITAFFTDVADEIAESKGGVSLRGIGYFFVHRIPRKLKPKRAEKGVGVITSFSHHTENYVYCPIFVPRRTFALQAWSMDGKFSFHVRKKLRDNLRNGYRYKSHVATIKHIIG